MTEAEKQEIEKVAKLVCQACKHYVVTGNMWKCTNSQLKPCGVATGIATQILLALHEDFAAVENKSTSGRTLNKDILMIAKFNHKTTYSTRYEALRARLQHYTGRVMEPAEVLEFLTGAVVEFCTLKQLAKRLNDDIQYGSSFYDSAQLLINSYMNALCELQSINTSAYKGINLYTDWWEK